MPNDVAANEQEQYEATTKQEAEIEQLLAECEPHDE